MKGLRKRIGRQIEEPERKRGYVRDLFADIARRYDITNDVMSFRLHRRWKRLVLDIADVPPGGRVLDLAAGTGDLALGAASRLEASRAGEGGAGGCVVAADLTPEMMEVGRERDGAEGVAWVRTDALQLPFDAESFDRVVVGYGLRNLADLRQGLAEVRRCLRPGGRLVSLDFARPRSRLLRKVYLRYLDLSTAVVGWILHRNPEAYVYIPESLRRFPDQDALVQLLHSTGFRKCGYVDLLFGTMAIHFAHRPEA